MIGGSAVWIQALQPRSIGAICSVDDQETPVSLTETLFLANIPTQGRMPCPRVALRTDPTLPPTRSKADSQPRLLRTPLRPSPAPRPRPIRPAPKLAVPATPTTAATVIRRPGRSAPGSAVRPAAAPVPPSAQTGARPGRRGGRACGWAGGSEDGFGAFAAVCAGCEFGFC